MSRIAVAAVVSAALAVAWATWQVIDRPQAAVASAAGPRRVVSLAPSMTEIVFALGAGDCLVGVTDCCNHPPEAAALPRAGGYGAPNVEQLVALKPDVVLANGMERPEVVDYLGTLGIEVCDARIRSFDDLLASVRQVGQLVGRQREAERLAAQMQEELSREIEAARAGSNSARPLRVFVLLWDDPLMTVGAGSLLDDLIARLDGRNVAHALPQDYVRINPEAVVAWDPEVILIAKMQGSSSADASIARRPGWTAVSAVRNGRIVGGLPLDCLLRPGPRLAEGVSALRAGLYPESK